jgi:uncharacterized protein
MFKKLALFIVIFLVLILSISCSSEPEPVGPPLEGEITDLAVEFIGNLVEEDFSSAVAFFNAEMKKAMSENQLRQTWRTLLTQQGEYVGEIEKRVEQSGDYAAVNVITEFAAGPINIRVVFDSDNRVAGLWFQPVQ